MPIIGTAGHVDHGKSTLVQALTGIDPDRLVEEKRRGMTIDLGFAHLDLPSGVRAGVVDVPGHARFLHNMLAGVHGMDVVLLVVAADEGIMPQTSEHLDILQLLDIERIVVALTKVDLAEPAMVDMVAADVRAELFRRGLTAALVRTAAPAGTGVDELKTLLAQAVAGVRSAADGRPRLPVDRSFVLTGFGTVVTGSLVDGGLSVGQELELVPAIAPGSRLPAPGVKPARVRVRGLQQHGKAVDSASPANRLAVNLQGIDHQDVHRGQVLAPPGTVLATRCVDVRLRVLAGAAPLRSGGAVRVHSGTAETSARLSILDATEITAGAEGWAQLRLAVPTAMRDGDRVVLRLPAAQLTVAGGRVVDARARPHRRGQPGLAEALAQRLELTGRVLAEVRQASGGSTREQLASRLGPGAIAEVGRLVGAGELIEVGGELFSVEAWAGLERAAHRALHAFHEANPLRAGMPREGMRAPLRLEGRALGRALEAMLRRGTIEARGPSLVALPGHRPRLTAAQQKAVDATLARLREHPLSPPGSSELSAAGLTSDLRAHLEELGDIVRLDTDVVIAAEGLARAESLLRAFMAENGTMTVAQARDALGSTRRTVVPLLEYFDTHGLTHREGDLRRLR